MGLFHVVGTVQNANHTVVGVFGLDEDFMHHRRLYFSEMRESDLKVIKSCKFDANTPVEYDYLPFSDVDITFSEDSEVMRFKGTIDPITRAEFVFTDLLSEVSIGNRSSNIVELTAAGITGVLPLFAFLQSRHRTMHLTRKTRSELKGKYEELILDNLFDFYEPVLALPYGITNISLGCIEKPCIPSCEVLIVPSSVHSCNIASSCFPNLKQLIFEERCSYRNLLLRGFDSGISPLNTLVVRGVGKAVLASSAFSSCPDLKRANRSVIFPTGSVQMNTADISGSRVL